MTDPAPHDPTPNDPAPHDLERFVTAQGGGTAEQALAEIRRGRKATHWMWFVLPQFAGLGSSPMAERYAIRSLAEARGYLAHPLLGARLRETARAVADSPTATADELFGSVDALKLRSSMTLFHRADPGAAVFADVLVRYFDGVTDQRTDALLTAAESPDGP